MKLAPLPQILCVLVIAAVFWLQPARGQEAAKPTPTPQASPTGSPAVSPTPAASPQPDASPQPAAMPETETDAEAEPDGQTAPDSTPAASEPTEAADSEETTAGAPEPAESDAEPAGPFEEPAEIPGEPLEEIEGVGIDLFSPGESLDLIPLREGDLADPSMLDLPGDLGPAEPGSDLLFSDDLPPLEALPALPSIPLGEADRVLTARYKKARITADKDPAVVALREKAGAASTFEDNRAAMREYYRLLFAKMREQDESIRARCDAMEQAYLERLSQTRVEPTIPLDPPPAIEKID